MKFSLLCLLFFVSTLLEAGNDKYRCIWRDNPATTMTIAWDQTSGSNPVVHYDIVDHGTNWASYAFTHSPDRIESAKGMDNNFARLTGLQPNTPYYFVIRDSEGVSQRFWFETAPDSPNERLSLIAGGDSRSNIVARQNANRMVGKLCAHAVLFGGDMTFADTALEWGPWFDHWQLTISSTGRMTPIITARGNHELSNNSIYNLFDAPSSDVYYALTFGQNLLRAYTLNSYVASAGAQATWLANDLQANSNVLWKTAQYHEPIIPHTSDKPDRLDQRDDWATVFDQYGVDLVIESDAHVVKSTWPILVSSAGGSDAGFIRDDANGVVYIGEGCWGAPLRSHNDNKTWTRNSDSFNQFKWIFVDQQRIEVRTVKTDNAIIVAEVDCSNRFELPANIELWSPDNGHIIFIENENFTQGPEVTLTAPLNGQLLINGQAETISAEASDANGSIDRVEFYVEENLVFSDNTAPYLYSWTPSINGNFDIIAKAYDNDGYSAYSSARITVIQTSGSISSQVSQSSDDAEENALLSTVSTSSSDLDMVDENFINPNQTIGIRFLNIEIPSNAQIGNAYMRFTADGTSDDNCNLEIRAQDDANPATFDGDNTNDISDRPTFSSTVPWTPPQWNTAEASGPNQETPNLGTLVETAVALPGWQIGNSIAFILTGSGQREAYSYDGNVFKAPWLFIDYTVSLPAIPNPNLGADTGLCPGESLQLNAGNYSAYFWNNDVSVGQAATFEVTTSGYYTVRVLDIFGQVGSDIIFVDAYTAPSLDLGPDQSSTCDFCPVQLDGPGGFTYAWSTGETSQSIEVSMTGNYSLTITDSNGCTAVDDITVTVTTDVSNIEASLFDFNLFPNPAEDKLWVNFNLGEFEEAALQIFDNQGRLVRDLGSLKTGQHLIDVSSFSSGIYFMHLRLGEQVEVQKFLILD